MAGPFHAQMSMNSTKVQNPAEFGQARSAVLRMRLLCLVAPVSRQWPISLVLCRCAPVASPLDRPVVLQVGSALR